MTRIRSGKKNILSNAFFALLLMTILVSVAIILPRILLNNTISGIRTSIGFITIRYSYNKSNLEIEITNHYSAPITVINITIKNNTYLLSETI
ncbi:MAG: hypothetical protein J7L82_07305, partial [Staphylothermus sp.]|nr:hypothetical protein [Staphylothermus sp.]